MEKRIILQKAMIHYERNDYFQFLHVCLPILKLAATSYESLSYSITGKVKFLM